MQLRCPYCRAVVVSELCVDPGATALVGIKCRSRRCRDRGKLSFGVRDGRVELLTADERAATVLTGAQNGA